MSRGEQKKLLLQKRFFLYSGIAKYAKSNIFMDRDFATNSFQEKYISGLDANLRLIKNRSGVTAVFYISETH